MDHETFADIGIGPESFVDLSPPVPVPTITVDLEMRSTELFGTPHPNGVRTHRFTVAASSLRDLVVDLRSQIKSKYAGGVQGDTQLSIKLIGRPDALWSLYDAIDEQKTIPLKGYNGGEEALCESINLILREEKKRLDQGEHAATMWATLLTPQEYLQRCEFLRR